MTIWSHLSIGSLLIAPGNTRSMSNLAEQELLETFALTTSGFKVVSRSLCLLLSIAQLGRALHPVGRNLRVKRIQDCRPSHATISATR